MAGDPVRGEQGGDGDRQDGDLGLEPGVRRQVRQHAPQRRLGELAGDEQDPRGGGHPSAFFHWRNRSEKSQNRPPSIEKMMTESMNQFTCRISTLPVWPSEGRAGVWTSPPHFSV